MASIAGLLARGFAAAAPAYSQRDQALRLQRMRCSGTGFHLISDQLSLLINRSGVECMYTQIIYPTKLYILEVKNHTIYRTGFFKEIKPNHKIGQKSMLIESINMKPI